MAKSAKSFQSLKCSRCTATVHKVDVAAVSVICWRCVAKKSAPPDVSKSSVKSDKPRGWKFMKEYVHTDGTVYHKGIEVPQLKGTLEVTVIKPKESKKLSKNEKHQLQMKLGTDIQRLKNEMFNEKRKTKRAEIQRTLQKLNKQLAKLK